MAIHDEDPTGLARKVLPLAFANVQKYCAQAVDSNGTWSETPDYWYFGTQAHAQIASALLTATGSTHDLLTANVGFRHTGFFHIYNNGITGKFNYGDCGPNKYTATANGLFFYGDRFDISTYSLYQRERPDAADPLSMFWYNPKHHHQQHQQKPWHHELPLDRSFPDPAGAWVSMRSSWTDPKGIFIGMKGGKMSGHESHGNLDAGDFVLDALGERWAGELCQDDYLSEGYFSGEQASSPRWAYYRCRTEGQNTITVGGANQVPDAAPASIRFNTTEGTTKDEPSPRHNDSSTAFWIADLSPAYRGHLQRGVRFLEGRTRVLLQDEIGSTSVESQWRMHTNATIEYESGGRIARRFAIPHPS